MIIDNKQDRYPYDNLNIVTVWDFLSTYAGQSSENTGKLDIVTGYFTIYSLSKLYEEMPEENHYRIISSELVGDDYKKDFIVDLLHDDLDISSIGELDKHARQAIAFLERESVEMRAQIPDFCHAKAYIFENSKPTQNSFYVTGSSNMTPAGLGFKKAPNVELNIAENCNRSNADYTELRKWYEDIWNAARKDVPEDRENPRSTKISVKEYFIRKIKEYFRTYSPEEIYYKILFELFNADLDLENGIEYTKDMSLLQTSVIWNTLFNYQQKGVISLIKMLRKHNGAILADAVGLGKTFSALAVIKYFQIQNYTTVLLCPKKLESNWKQYLLGAKSRFEKDEFNYQVRFHTDLQDDRLQKSYDLFKLDYLKTRKKVLVVIDESHNLRNEKSGRYQTLLTELLQNQSGQENRDVKVLMLSATPINTGLNDVKGQFNLIAHGYDGAFNNEEFDVESLNNTFKDAQGKYTIWCSNPKRTIGGFIGQLPQRFFNLTDKLIVARTRKLIEKTLGEDLGFPEREKPINVYQGIDHFGEYHSAEEIYKAFEALHLTAYQPSLYLFDDSATARASASTDWDSNVNRERFLVKMMCILFMKRLESSWYALLLTVKKVLDCHENVLQKVIAYETSKVDDIIRAGEVFDDDDDFETATGRQINVSDIKNLSGFKKDLQQDKDLLSKIYDSLLDFKGKYELGKEDDLKLKELIKIFNQKKECENKKLVVFTAYADTAKFLYEELKNRYSFTRMAMVTGQEVLSTGKHSSKDFTEVLQSFAPFCKLYNELDWEDLYEKNLDRAIYYNDEKQRWKVPYDVWQDLVRKHQPQYAKLLDDGIDILIATDCLSEGQNLQDADMQINYDIHWNPVRLIQRFGRIDRIGSRSKKIRCVNFWPAKSVEAYLQLEERVQNRMSIMTLVGSETQELNEHFNEMVKDNPLQDRNADRLLNEIAQNSISDIESPTTLSLKDFSFETYRQDLIAFYEKQQDFYRKMPNGVFSGFINDKAEFADMPESLIALVGFPKKPVGKKVHSYTELYLVCQPMNAAPEWTEINKADVLEFLRKNKEAKRNVPQWITDSDSKKITELSDALKEWMRNKAPKQAIQNIKGKLKKQKPNARAEHGQQLSEEHFKIENFDLIVWEYVSKD